MGEPSIDVKRGAADPVLTAKLRDRQPTLGLAQHSHDLRLSKTTVLHRNLLVHNAEKILRMHPLKLRGDYRPTLAISGTSASLAAGTEADRRKSTQVGAGAAISPRSKFGPT